MGARAALCPYDYDHSATKEAGGDLANFAIVKSLVGHRVSRKHLLRVDREIETAMRNRPVALGGVEGRLHTDIVTT
jgi:hypothetical protein